MSLLTNQRKDELTTRISIVKASVKSYVKHLRNKGRWHWLAAIALIAIGLFGEHLMDRHMVWERFRYRLYRSVQVLDLHPVRPKRTMLILIGDDEYWDGELARRVPIKRDYLAKLVTAIDKAEPSVIVLDFILRSPVPQSGPQESAEYAQETKLLVDAIKEVSSKRKIVTPSTVRLEGDNYVREPTILDRNGFDPKSVAEGYITLPDDMREIPLTLSLKDGSIIDSLATATARLTDDQAVTEAEEMRGEALPYGTFVDPEKFSTLSSSQALSLDARTLKSKMGCNIVLIGGAWHKDAYGQGPQADAILTPAGEIAGVFAHANFIEALLDSRTFKPLADWQKVLLGLLLSVLVAITTASPWHPAIRFAIVVAISALPLMISYFFRQNLGIFFDFFLPVIMLLAHWAVVRD